MLVFPKYAKSANLSRRIADVLTISCCRELANFPPEFHVPFVTNLIDENVEYWVSMFCTRWKTNRRSVFHNRLSPGSCNTSDVILSALGSN